MMMITFGSLIFLFHLLLVLDASPLKVPALPKGGDRTPNSGTSPPVTPHLRTRTLHLVSYLSSLKIREDETLVPGGVETRCYYKTNYKIMLTESRSCAFVMCADQTLAAGNCGKVSLARVISRDKNEPLSSNYVVVKESLTSPEDRDAAIAEILTPTIKTLLRKFKLEEYKFIADESEREVRILRHLGKLEGEVFSQENGSKLFPVKLARGIQFDEYLEKIDSLAEFEIEQLEKLFNRVVEQAFKPVHDKGVVHGDCHLGNIIYDPESETAELIDFGRSKLIKTTEEFSVHRALESYFSLFYERNPERIHEDIYVIKTEFAAYLKSAFYDDEIVDYFRGKAEEYRREKGIVVFGGSVAAGNRHSRSSSASGSTSREAGNKKKIRIL